MSDENSPAIDNVPRMQTAHNGSNLVSIEQPVIKEENDTPFRLSQISAAYEAEDDAPKSKKKNMVINEESVAVDNTTSDDKKQSSADSVAVDSAFDDEGIWSCSACTFINENPLHLTCDVCGAPKHSDHDVPPMQIARNGSNEVATKQPEVIEDDEAPFRLSQIAAVSEAMDNATKSTKKNTSIIGDMMPMPREGIEYSPATIGHQEHPVGSTSENHHFSTQTHVPTETISPTTDERDDEQSSPNSGHVELRIQSTPRSMLPCPNDEPSVSSVPMLEATCVEDSTVYEAYAVQDNDASFWKRHQKYILVGVAALVFGAMAATIGTLVGKNRKDETDLYFADHENNRCDIYPPGQPRNTRQRSFASMEECCRTVFWLEGGNECMLNSLRIPHKIPISEKTSTTPPTTPPTTASIFTAKPTASTTAAVTTVSSATPSTTSKTVASSTTASLTKTSTTTTFAAASTAAPTTAPKALSSGPSLEPQVWKQQGQAIVGNAAGDEAGRSVALSDDGMTLAIGAPGDYTDDRRGYVKVYHKESQESSWKQLGSDIQGQADGDNLGWSLSLSANGRTLAIGAPGYFEKNDRPGYVRVYYMEDADFSWKQLGQGIIGQATGDQFGYSVSISPDGKNVAIGANGSGPSGQVRVYHIDHIGTGVSWKQLGQEINGEASGDNSGFSVALSGDGITLAIGARRNDENGNNAGHVRVYEMRDDGNGPSWEQVGQDIDGQASDDWFGSSVALSSDGKTLAIGAPAETTSREGYMRVYRRGDDGSSSSFQQLGQTIVGEAPSDLFGISVDLSQDGKTLAVGANGNDDNEISPGHVRVGSDSGHVKVYHLDSSTSRWTQLGQDINGEKAGDNAGLSVSLSANGKTLAIGSVWNDDNGYKSGHVRVFGI